MLTRLGRTAVRLTRGRATSRIHIAVSENCFCIFAAMAQLCVRSVRSAHGRPIENWWSRRPDRVVSKGSNGGFLPICSLDRASSAYPALFQLAGMSNGMRQFWRILRIKRYAFATLMSHSEYSLAMNTSRHPGDDHEMAPPEGKTLCHHRKIFEKEGDVVAPCSC